MACRCQCRCGYCCCCQEREREKWEEIGRQAKQLIPNERLFRAFVMECDRDAAFLSLYEHDYKAAVLEFYRRMAGNL